jgi:glutathione S-transferase
MSPFSEKVRLMFGCAGGEWLSVISPEMPPRAIVDPLAGGYRRIPVAQIGADVFCDTRLICAELANAAARPGLNPASLDAQALALAEKFDGEVFWAAVASIPPHRVLLKLLRELSVRQAFRFIKDRAGVARAAVTKPLSPRAAGPLFAAHLEEVEGMLAGGAPFLLGDAPSYLDFAAYHTLWFKLVVGGLPMPDGLPAVASWYRLMTEFGHGHMREGSGEEAFAAAREQQPRPLPPSTHTVAEMGKPVVIRPDDYALDGTAGVLVGVDEERWILARETPDLGLVHVHFPRRGFSLD